MAVMTSSMEDAIARALALAATGDESAFARIVDAHHGDMTRVCFAICGDLDLADEAVQAAWPIAWRKLGTLHDPERLRPWLVAIAANEARQLVRHRRRRRLVEMSVPHANPGDTLDPAVRAADLDLAEAFSRLSPDDRTLLALRYVAGFDSTELGRATGRSASGTRARLARLLERLRSELADD
jgi:RNA polymerase sigma factor (sigma-70 family)